VIAEAGRDANLRAVARLNVDPTVKASRDRDDRKVLVFSYFADTIYYLQDNIDLVLDAHPDLAVYKDRVAFVTGSMSKTPGHGAHAGAVVELDEQGRAVRPRAHADAAFLAAKRAGSTKLTWRR
jgi:hypothetical protein